MNWKKWLEAIIIYIWPPAFITIAGMGLVLGWVAILVWVVKTVWNA